MTVELDFVEDLVNQLRTELIAAGFNEAADRAIVSDDEIGILYFNSLIRTIDAKPRKVLTSSMYAKTLPKAHEPKVKALLEKISRGDDLVPHQSRKLVMKKLLQTRRNVERLGNSSPPPRAKGHGRVADVPRC